MTVWTLWITMDPYGSMDVCVSAYRNMHTPELSLRGRCTVSESQPCTLYEHYNSSYIQLQWADVSMTNAPWHGITCLGRTQVHTSRPIARNIVVWNWKLEFKFQELLPNPTPKNLKTFNATHLVIVKLCQAYRIVRRASKYKRPVIRMALL